MRPMKLMTIIFLVALLCFMKLDFCEAHDAFYPHHLKDVKAAAKRGKILVITLIVTAGLLVLISTAVIRSGKEKKSDAIEKADPTELRASVISAVTAGRQGMAESREKALNMALSAYARARGMEWRSGERRYLPSAAYIIGKDRVTVSISENGAVVEVSAISGGIGASAIANAADNSTHSTVFSSHSMDRGERKRNSQA